jgi:hypothetical protein
VLGYEPQFQWRKQAKATARKAPTARGKKKPKK